MDGREKEKGRTPAGRPSTNNTSTRESNSLVQQAYRRREASYRLPPLEHSGRRDPWHYDPPGERGYEDAAAHLLELGLTPAPHVPAMRSMWKRGGRSFRAARIIAERWGLAA